MPLTWYVRDIRPSRPLLAGPLASAMHRSSGCPPGRATCRGGRGGWPGSTGCRPVLRHGRPAVPQKAAPLCRRREPYP